MTQSRQLEIGALEDDINKKSGFLLKGSFQRAVKFTSLIKDEKILSADLERMYKDQQTQLALKNVRTVYNTIVKVTQLLSMEVIKLERDAADEEVRAARAMNIVDATAIKQHATLDRDAAVRYKGLLATRNKQMTEQFIPLLESTWGPEFDKRCPGVRAAATQAQAASAPRIIAAITTPTASPAGSAASSPGNSPSHSPTGGSSPVSGSPPRVASVSLSGNVATLHRTPPAPPPAAAPAQQPQQQLRAVNGK